MMTSSSWQKSARTAFLIMLWTFTIFVVAECCWGATAPLIGKMPPDQDIEVGSSISLNCTLLNESITLGGQVHHVNSSMIAFKFSSQYLPSDNVDILDPYTATLRIRNATAEQSGLYYCFVQVPGVRNVTVCVSSVNIGYPPRPVQSFACISSNLENLTCYWTPQPNKVVPSYNLQEVIGYEDHYRGYVRPCPDRISATSCQWRMDSNPPYRQNAKVLHLRLIGNNSLGSYVQNIKIENYKIVLPNQPENFNHKAVGTTYVVLVWSPPKHMEVFQPGLIYQIHYGVQSQNEEGLKVINVTKNMLEYNLTNLVPFTSYTFKLRCISSIADNKDMWSVYTYTVALTSQDKPYLAPVVSPQGFEVQNFETNRTIKIYWKFVPPEYYNGDNFQYAVSFYPTFVERPKRESDTTLLHSKSFFFNDNFDCNTAYQFTIRSVNNMGTSANFSSLTVDKKGNMPSTPTDITAVSLPHGVYKVSWKPPNNPPSPIVNYTVFWCQNLKPRPYPCVGDLDWTYVVGHQNVSLTLPSNNVNYQFAVSANTNYSSSGMEWASCLVPYDGVLGKIEQVNVEAVNSTSLKVIWKLECNAQKAVVTEYQILACVDTNVSCQSNICSGPQAVYSVTDPQASSFIISGLQPFTYFGIKIRALTAKGRNEDSDIMCEQTLSGAPSDPPQNVILTDIQNTTATIEWEPPQHPNGVLTKYIVYYNDKSAEVNGVTQKVTIEGLRCYNNYTFQVNACVGNDCSNKSEPLTTRTAIGVPGLMDTLITEYLNSTYMRISWKPPWYANGPIDSYFIKMYVSDGENETLMQILNVTGDHNDSIIAPDCEAYKNGKYNLLRIQAVNVVGNQTLVGPLSKNFQSKLCIDPGKTPALTMILGVVIGGTLGLAALVFVLYFLVRWMKRKIDLMKDVKVKLPKGLDSPYSNPLNSYENFMNGLIRRSSTNLSPKLEPPAPPPPPPPDFTEDDEGFKNRHGSGNSQFSASSTDELLQKKGSRNYKLGRNPSGESSGCSSGGHDSISSSGTHHTNVSSDSGTEVDMASTNFSEPGCNAEEMLKKKPAHEYSKLGDPLDAYLQKGGLAPSKCYVTPYSLFGTDKMPLPHCRALSLYGHNLANSEPSVADLGTEEEPYSSTKFTDDGWRLYSKFGLSNSTADVRDPYDGVGGQEKGLTPYSRFGICRPPADKLPYVTVGMALMLSDKDSPSNKKRFEMQPAKKCDQLEKKRDGYVSVNQALNPSHSLGGCYSMFGIQEKDEPEPECHLPVPSSSKGYVSLHDVQIKLNNPTQSEDLNDEDVYDDEELLDSLSVPELMEALGQSKSVAEDNVAPTAPQVAVPIKNGYISHDFASKLPQARDSPPQHALPDVVCCTGTEWRTDGDSKEVSTVGDALNSKLGKADFVMKELGLVCNEV